MICKSFWDNPNKLRLFKTFLIGYDTGYESYKEQ